MDIATFWQLAANIAITISPAGLVVGYYYAYKQWKSMGIQWESMRNSRMAQLLDSLSIQWNSEEMAKARQAVNKSGRNLKVDLEKADKENELSSYTDYIRIANFFDEIGILVSEGFIKCSIVWQVWGKAEEHYYRFYESIINSEENKGFFPNFIKLHELFKNEAACHTTTKSKHAA